MYAVDNTMLIIAGLVVVALLVLATVAYRRRSKPQTKPPSVRVDLLPESYLTYNGDLLVDAAAFVEAENLCEHPVKLSAFRLKVGKHLVHMIETKGKGLPFDLQPKEMERFKFRKRDFNEVPVARYVDATTAAVFFAGADAETYSSGKQKIQVYKEEGRHV